MWFLSKTSVYYIYIVSIFGAIDIITNGLKLIPNTILFSLALLTFGLQLFYKKRLIVTDFLIFAFALLSSLGLALFVSDLIFHPIAVAADCEGHMPSRTHYFDIIVVGFLVTGFWGSFFLKTHKQKNVQDKVFPFIFIIILILCFRKATFFKNLNESIDNVSKPTYVLPKGC